MYFALIAGLGVAASTLQTTDAFARSGSASGAFASMRPIGRPGVAHSFRHHGRGFVGGTFWPGDVDTGSPAYGEPVTAAPLGNPNDVHYTYTYDVPWDWAHRYPPQVVPSDRPYVSSCPVESVKVAGSKGGEQTVNVMRCY
jgi:hypothetical protein